MRFPSFKCLSLGLLSGSIPLAFSAPFDGNGAGVVARQAATTSSAATTTATRTPDPACTNSPSSRNCWQNGFSVATDFDAKAPPAGVTRPYTITITNGTAAPDGKEQGWFLMNGQPRGPTITGNWGDTFVVTIVNDLAENGTSIHWHGVRQLNSCQMDGVNGVTECPIAPKTSKTYTFKATQFGTSWYHSHYSAQYGEGVVGAIVINGPATANYDEDLGVLPLTDLYYPSAWAENYANLHSGGGPAPSDNILVNGTHKNADGGGAYYRMKVTKGKKYRIRLINTSVDAMFHVSLDGHPMQVITSDFVPIHDYYTNEVKLNIGQRHDIIVNANQTSDNYWFRVGLGTDCSNSQIIASGIQMGAIFTYDDASDTTAEPTTTGVTLTTTCEDELKPDGSRLIPFVDNEVPQDDFETARKTIGVELETGRTDNLVQWLINGTAMDVDWSIPTLQHVIDGTSNWGNQSNLIEMPNNQWYFWLIQSVDVQPLPHPIHLHGHDFYEIGKGSGSYDGSNLVFSNPTRRDTATLPAAGWMLIGFPADNPGAWLMHCHIAWHVSQGLSLQFLERRSEIVGAIGDTSGFTSGCESWNSWWTGPDKYWPKDDSGLRI